MPLQFIRFWQPSAIILIVLFMGSAGVQQSQAQVWNVLDFGAVGNGNTVNTTAIQAAIDTCHRAGGGQVVIPAGVFVSGTLELKTNVTLHIAAGGTLRGSGRLSDYPEKRPALRSYADNYSPTSLLYAENARNIRLTGPGTVDGNGSALEFLFNDSKRPFGIRFISCQKVRIDSIQIRNSAFWMMHNLNIDTLDIEELDLYNFANSNGDGINVDGCRNVWIRNCRVDSNNDPIVLKTTSTAETDGVLVENCRVSTLKRALKIGTETHAPIRNVKFRNCQVVQTPSVGTRADCGINLSVVDGGSMENIELENIDIAGVNTPLFVRLGNRARTYDGGPTNPAVGLARNIRLKNIRARGYSASITSCLTGISGHPIQNLELTDIELTVPGGGKVPPQGFEVPENEGGKPEHNLLGEVYPSHGLYFRHIDGLTLRNVCVKTETNDARPALWFEASVGSLVTAAPCGSTTDRYVPGTASGFTGLLVYPNPGCGSFQIRTGEEVRSDLHLRIADLTGRIVWQAPASCTPEDIFRPALPPGLYRVVVESGGRFWSETLVWE